MGEMLNVLYCFEQDQAYHNAATGAGEKICFFKVTFSS